MGPKKLTDEEKEKQYENFRNSGEWTSIMKFVEKRKKIPRPFDMD